MIVTLFLLVLGLATALTFDRQEIHTGAFLGLFYPITPWLVAVNLVWLAWLGRTFERSYGAMRTLALCVFGGAVAACYELLWSGSSASGLAGVTAALAGFFWIRSSSSVAPGYYALWLVGLFVGFLLGWVEIPLGAILAGCLAGSVAALLASSRWRYGLALVLVVIASCFIPRSGSARLYEWAINRGNRDPESAVRHYRVALGEWRRGEFEAPM